MKGGGDVHHELMEATGGQQKFSKNKVLGRGARGARNEAGSTKTGGRTECGRQQATKKLTEGNLGNKDVPQKQQH